MRSKRLFSVVFLIFLIFHSCNSVVESGKSDSDLVFNALAQRWDEGLPLGNGNIGALVWKKGGALRFSLDRMDLWDLRAVDSLSGDNYRFSWVRQQVEKGDYLPVQKKFDHPYDMMPAPSKIPGAGLEFSLDKIGEPNSVRLLLNDAVAEVRWDNGTLMRTFVHATEPVGWFAFYNLKEDIEPVIVPPVYELVASVEAADPVTGQDLRLLGYKQGVVKRDENRLIYHQEGWDGFYYDVVVEWTKAGNNMYGAWSISSSISQKKGEGSASNAVRHAFKRGMNDDFRSHLEFWHSFSGASSVTLPDSILQKQYDNEIYKFGSSARENSYPISLQGVWTADNGKLPPWKGDFHHDLNTQLSYWPAYTGNHLTEAMGYLNTLWDQRDTYRRYTRQYFEKDGMAIPGVCTLKGVEMGGWIQYAMSPTVAAWLSHHFYLQWKYSMDRDFLSSMAYPFIKECAVFLENLTEVDINGIRKLPLSSSPEMFDNSINAWFRTMSNYDLALCTSLFRAAAELSSELKLDEEAAHWKGVMNQLPQFNLDANGALTIAEGFPYKSSHRHFSHAMAIHPLGLIDWSNGENDQKIIRETLNLMDEMGPGAWTGYSYAWMGNMKARAMDGDGAAEALRIFAECFCKKNTFHANGDQTKSGKSGFTYDPFTLEGNFAFASGIQEMLLQSHTGVIRVFPAIPSSWNKVSFKSLRAMGAFLVSASKENTDISIRVFSEKGGVLKIISPLTGELLVKEMEAGESWEM